MRGDGSFEKTTKQEPRVVECMAVRCLVVSQLARTLTRPFDVTP